MSIMRQNQQSPAIADNFRAAMRRFPATVTVVTAVERGTKIDHGMTATAVTSVSMEPPSLLICLNNRTWLREIVMNNGEFIVNVLGQDHAGVSDAFSGKVAPEDRFRDGNWLRHETGILMLPSAHANLVCRCAAAVPYGTHTVFIGEVIDVHQGQITEPLLYDNARYAGVMPAALSI